MDFLIVFDSEKNILTQYKKTGIRLGSQWYVLGQTTELLADCFCDYFKSVLLYEKHNNNSIMREYIKFHNVLNIIELRAKNKNRP